MFLEIKTVSPLAGAVVNTIVPPLKSPAPVTV
jgi:hypothetical protein